MPFFVGQFAALFYRVWWRCRLLLLLLISLCNECVMCIQRYGYIEHLLTPAKTFTWPVFFSLPGARADKSRRARARAATENTNVAVIFSAAATSRIYARNGHGWDRFRPCGAMCSPCALATREITDNNNCYEQKRTKLLWREKSVYREASA